MHSEPIPAEGAGAIDGVVAASMMDVPCQRPPLRDEREGEFGGNVGNRFPRLASEDGRAGTGLAERAVLFQLMCDEHEECWELGELEAVLSDLPGCSIAVAIERLARHGAVVRGEGRLSASACTRHLDSLGIVAI